jgi:hypothetical protein
MKLGLTRGFLLQRWKRLHRDEGGNIIVLYIAAALLLVGMLWAIIGTGARMVQKETIQSSADAAAFSAAVIKAKGLNIIAFCNLVMALLLAIIMLLRLIKGALMMLVGAAALSCALAWTGAGGVLCPFLPTAKSLYTTYSNLVDRVEPRIMDAMKGMAKLERAINKTFPALSLVEAYRVGTHDHYKKNFGAGALVTIAWPLPVGKDLSLPTKDGTWERLCDEAANTVGRVLEAAMQKMGLPGFVTGVFKGFVMTLLSPLKGVLCGGGGGGNVMIDVAEIKNTCAECEGAEKTKWVGDRVDPGNTNVTLEVGATCSQDGFNSYLCENEPDGYRVCDGKAFINLKFAGCLKKTQKPAEFGNAINDKPVPLVLADDWKERINVRAFTLLSDTKMEERRQSVNVASKQKGSAPMLNQMLGTAQAEFFAHNGSEDLWHMNWRARLVRFTFGDTSSTNTGEAGSQGVPGAGASAISQKIKDFMLKDGAAAFADQFLLH